MFAFRKFFSCKSNFKCLEAVKISRNSSSYNQKPPASVLLREAGPNGWLLLTIPAAAFALGTWQVQRKRWKEGLIAELRESSREDPVELPERVEDVEKLEYRPVRVRGRFLHDKELYMGPRTLLKDGDSSTQSSLLSGQEMNSQGYLVVTPFKLADRDRVILVNRGWVPARLKSPQTRQKGQIENEVTLIGIVRLNEPRPNFSIKNKGNNWFYRDLFKMAHLSNASPVFLDVTSECDVPGGPIGGQTRIGLRNEHLSYIITWYSLSACTGYMWYFKFLK